MASEKGPHSSLLFQPLCIAGKESLPRSQGFNSMSLFCFVASLAQQNYFAMDLKTLSDKRFGWLFSKCAHGEWTHSKDREKLSEVPKTPASRLLVRFHLAEKLFFPDWVQV